MKLEYSPTYDVFFVNDFGVSRQVAKSLYYEFKDTAEMSGMNKIIEFNWDMKRVHDYYGNGD